MKSSIVKLEINNLEEIFEFNKVAKQADGAVLYRQGKAALIATVVFDNDCSSEDFLPLTVQYIEKSYAAAKIPGGFIKRESKPGDFETLTSRIIDRAIRPLFPDGFSNNVVITVTVVSSDPEVDLQIAALHAANAALLVSSLPIEKSIAALRVGKINEQIIYNPKNSDFAKSKLDLLLVGSKNDITMIEMRAIATNINSEHQINEITHSELINILEDSAAKIDAASKRYFEEFSALKSKQAFEMQQRVVDKELTNFIRDNFAKEIDFAIENMSKSESTEALKTILKNIENELEDKSVTFDEISLKEAFYSVVKEKIRALILNGSRIDGRKTDEIRSIEIETNLLPSVHGSTLFTRGETQALVTATIGDNKDAQMYELLTSKKSMNENFMVHYNFPPYSVGEARPIGAPSRRELGHGNLAKRALEPTVCLEPNQTVRVVSEILESNGSSSMATVCGGSLALVCANVDVKKLTAGIAMGVVVANSEKYTILSDIMGAEDHYGDMDFKITGTKDGITAMQLDIKLDGLNLNILKEALAQAEKGLLHILELMEHAKSTIVPSGALPSQLTFEIDPSNISLVIGKGGSTIRDIIDRFNVSIDLDRDNGIVKISSNDEGSLESAKEFIENLIEKENRPVTQYEIGKVYKGIVKKSVDFGYFIEMPDGYDALLHNSKIPSHLQGTLNEGDTIDVIVMSQQNKRVELALS